MVVITSDRRDIILDAVQSMYTDVAMSPERGYHFPTGRAACEFVGYPQDVLATVPARVLESFAGVGYPFAANVIGPGSAVLDIGSGSGTDVFIASRLTGDAGRVIGLDMTAAMREKLLSNLEESGIHNVEVLAGEAESLPLEDASIDVVTSNGVINLVPDKQRAIGEIFRVLRPGGFVQIADILLEQAASDTCRSNPELWAECIVGATTRVSFADMLRDSGFLEIETLATLDYFGGSSNGETRGVASSLGAMSAVMRARKPGDA